MKDYEVIARELLARGLPATEENIRQVVCEMFEPRTASAFVRVLARGSNEPLPPGWG